MSRRLALLVAVGLAALALAGCLGSDTEPVNRSVENETTPEPQPLGNPATLHRLSEANATGTLDSGEALEGLPTPAAIGLEVPGPLFEPTIGVTSDGAIFVSNTGEGEPTEEDPPPDTEYSSILRSTDHGSTWEDVTGSLGPVSIPPNTGDPYVYVDPDTDRVYNLDMIGLNCNWVRFSDDRGESWTNNPLGCGQPAFQDHPTIFAGEPTTLETQGYENVVYVCVNRLVESACAVSLDGGLAWSPWRTVYPPNSPDGNSICGGLHAHGTTGPEGTAYLPKAHCGTPSVAISGDDGLTWDVTRISDVAAASHEVAFAVDDRGNGFALWIGASDLHPYLAVSTDGGSTWERAVDVAPPNVSVTSHPTIAAGSNGSIALAYVGTEAEAPNYTAMPEDAEWNGYLATVADATREDPVVATATANDPEHPIGMGVCGGTRCRADDDAGIGDFIDVTIDDEGRPWGVFVDVCRETCERARRAQRETGVGLVGTLAEGPALRGPLDPLPPLTANASAPANASPNERSTGDSPAGAAGPALAGQP